MRAVSPPGLPSLSQNDTNSTFHSTPVVLYVTWHHETIADSPVALIPLFFNQYLPFLGDNMKSFDTRTYSINDFLEWDKGNQLELNPKYQRRSVWSDTARSYLMDTIIRGKPIPKIFIRQKLNPTTKTSIREVVDGQQRLRTILLYLKDGFQISKKHNEQFGGYYFSQLDEVDDDIQGHILNYEISVDLLINMPDSEVLDVFSRLNSYAVTLNEQEKINANHFGPFKSLVDRVGHKYYDFWIGNRILTDAQILRMGEITLVADLMIAAIEGIKSKKQIKTYYDQYETKFEHEPKELEGKFDNVIKTLNNLFPESLRTSEFKSIPLFYSLFTAVYHKLYGLRGFDGGGEAIDEADYPRLRNQLENIENIFDVADKSQLSKGDLQFFDDSRRATTDAKVRVRRTKFILKTLIV